MFMAQSFVNFFPVYGIPREIPGKHEAIINEIDESILKILENSW